MLPETLSLQGYDRLLVAFSGGMDSAVLLHMLAGLRQTKGLTLRAVHIHHGISRYADDWQQHCQQVCDDLAIPLLVRKVTLCTEGRGIEAAAREARYTAFSELLQPGEALVTAHHQDDQCETLLLALKRGSGPAGLSAMPPVLRFGSAVLLRPLLPFTRQQLAAYAAQYQLHWVEDDSNQDTAYDRNFLRLKILPQLEQRWPRFTAAVTRSAELCGEQEALLDELLRPELDNLITNEKAIPVGPLAGFSAVRRAAILRRWLMHCGAPMPSRDALARLWQEIALSREDANPRLTLGEGELRRYDQHLWWVRVKEGQRQTVLHWSDRQTPLILPAGLGCLTAAEQGIKLRLPTADERLSVRFTVPGKLYIVGRDRGRSLKKIWQECGIPPWRRETTPVLFYNDEPVCAPGVFVTRYAEPKDLPDADCWWLNWTGQA